MKTTSTTTAIAATGSGSALTHAPNPFGPDSEGVVVVSGTYTSPTLVVEKKVAGSSVWVPVALFDEKTYTKYSGSVGVTTDTTSSYRFSCGGAVAVRAYCSAGTGLSMTVTIATGTADEFGGPSPVLNSVASGTQTFADVLILDNNVLKLGTDSDFTAGWDGTNVNFLAAADNTTLVWGASGNSFDWKVFGAGASTYFTFDASADSLKFEDNVYVGFGTNTAGVGTKGDINITFDGTDLLVAQTTADTNIKWGVSGAGINHVFYGDTATRDMSWDQSNDQLLFADNAKLAIGTGAGGVGDIAWSWDATRCNVTQLTANSEIRWGVDGAGIDQMWYGDTASAYANWDQSADALVFGGVAGITNLKVKQSTAVAITGATTLVLADSGGHFTVSQAAAYDIDLPSPTTGAGATYFFHLTGAAANNVTLTVAGSAATFVGTITIDGATIVATGSTLTFASGASALGDSIMVRSLATNLYHVVAIASGAGGITIA